MNKSLITKMADRYGVDASKLLSTLKATVFHTREPISNEQMMMLLVVADKYGLDPFTKEIYPLPDRNNGIVPVVGVDGWCRIINSHPNFDGVEFRYSENLVRADENAQLAPDWMECIIHRKDRNHPTVVREYLAEVYKPAHKNAKGYAVKGPWQTHTNRFFRHKTLIQCSRVAFGFAGIYDHDEAERIIAVQTAEPAHISDQAEKQGRPALEHMPDEVFAANIGDYTQIIKSGTSADELVGIIGTRYQVTEQQLSTLYDIESAGDKDHD